MSVAGIILHGLVILAVVVMILAPETAQKDRD